MSNILIIHSSDAEPLLGRFREGLDIGPTAFLNVEDVPANDLRSRIFESSQEIETCLILSSDRLLHLLAPLAHLGQSRRGQYLLAVPETIAIQLSLDRRPRGVRSLWRKLFGASDAIKSKPLLRMSEREFIVFIYDIRSTLELPPRVFAQARRRLSTHDEAMLTLYLRREIPAAAVTTFIDQRTVELLFATNRAPVKGPEIADFSGERAETLSYGGCKVHVPLDHKIGQLELPKKANWLLLRFTDEKPDETRHFVIKGISTFDQDEFCDIVHRDPTKTALVFVHGFNTSFQDSVLRFAQIIWDMQFKGAPVLFSWPSAGGVLNYIYDLNSAMGARVWFQKLIQLLRADAGVETIHIIAHSMGNFIVLDALSELAKAGSLPGLSEVVMAAPDVDVDVYKSLATSIRPKVRGMTLYASANDKALVASRKAARKPRAGDLVGGRPVLLSNIESIDVSAIGDEMFGLNHNVFASNRSLVDDIGRLVLSGARPPNQRSPQIRCVPEGNDPPDYWRYVP